MKTFKTCALLLVFAFLGCTKNSADLGSKENPIKFYLVPAQDVLTLVEQGKVLQKYLSAELGLEFRIEVPSSYVAVVEAMGSKRADVAILNTLGYVLANEKYGAEAKLKLMNRGRDSYSGQIIVHASSGIKDIHQLNGKRFAFVDPASTSGYLLPSRLFKKENVKLKETIFAGKHDSVVLAVYQKAVDAGATFYTPPDDDGTPKDARWILRTQHPDVYEKVKILQLTEAIPNDPVVFRKEMPEELKVKIVEALKKYIKTPEGGKVMMDLYHITDFKEATDADYEPVRGYLKELGKTAQDFIK
ncbi:MAG: phosphonates-binding protein [Pseudobdellovibrio sp.]|jgi:phosphonate transport system substrate-binding protein|nr:phosphonates-binding protein [Pseudobdellovibrio sp.]